MFTVCLLCIFMRYFISLIYVPCHHGTPITHQKRSTRTHEDDLRELSTWNGFWLKTDRSVKLETYHKQTNILNAVEIISINHDLAKEQLEILF